MSRRRGEGCAWFYCLLSVWMIKGLPMLLNETPFGNDNERIVFELDVLSSR